MALLSSPHARAGPCPVCGGDCAAFGDTDHLSTYPFLPGGRDPMAKSDYVIAPHRIVDPVLERVMYGTGERVPLADAVKYGLIDEPVQPATDTPVPGRAKGKREEPAARTEPKRPKGKRRPAEDRARHLSEDRA